MICDGERDWEGCSGWLGTWRRLVATLFCERAGTEGGGRRPRCAAIVFIFGPVTGALLQRLTLFERHRSPTPHPPSPLLGGTSCHWSPSLGRLLGLALYDGPEISLLVPSKNDTQTRRRGGACESGRSSSAAIVVLGGRELVGGTNTDSRVASCTNFFGARTNVSLSMRETAQVRFASGGWARQPDSSRRRQTDFSCAR